MLYICAKRINYEGSNNVYLAARGLASYDLGQCLF